MDHLTPYYRSSRLARSHHRAEADSFLLAAQRRRRPQVLRTLAWATLGATAGLLLVGMALVAPDGLVLFGLLAGILFGASRG